MMIKIKTPIHPLKKKFSGALLLMIVVLQLFMSCNKDDDNTMVPEETAIEETAGITDIVETAKSSAELSEWIALLEKITTEVNDETIGEFATEPNLMAFIPNNQAFEDLFASLEGYDSLDDFKSDDELDALGHMLAYQISTPILYSDDLGNKESINTPLGILLGVRKDGDSIYLKDISGSEATVVRADVVATNGIIHVVDKVLIPMESFEQLLNPQPGE